MTRCIARAVSTSPAASPRGSPVIEAIAERLAAGETVKLSGFGTFSARDKGARMGRNPTTGAPAPISPRRVVRFRASAVLKSRIAEGRADIGNET